MIRRQAVGKFRVVALETLSEGRAFPSLVRLKQEGKNQKTGQLSFLAIDD